MRETKTITLSHSASSRDGERAAARILPGGISPDGLSADGMMPVDEMLEDGALADCISVEEILPDCISVEEILARDARM